MQMRAEEIGAATVDAYKRGQAAERARWEKLVETLVDAGDAVYALLSTADQGSRESRDESWRIPWTTQTVTAFAALGAALAAARELLSREATR